MLDKNIFLSLDPLDGLAQYLGFPNYKALSKLIYPKPQYRTFVINKKSGGGRIISAPKFKIKELQKNVLRLMQEYVHESKPSVHGFIKDRSVVTNAKQHLNKQFVLNIDLEDFFGTINFGRVRGLFKAKPFEFPNETATVLSHICCMDQVLPQGAPTSPMISNLICRQLDSKLQHLAKKYRATYTRYCDDITFSFTARRSNEIPKGIVKTADGIHYPGDELTEIINGASFKINHSKTRLLGRGGRMDVTGITVNADPNVRRNFVHEIRGMLHSWEKYGLAKAEEGLNEGSRYRRQLRSGKRPKFEKVLRGKLLYLAMVKGKTSPVYIRLAKRFNHLLQNGNLPNCLKVKFSRTVLDTASAKKATFKIEGMADVKVPGKKNAVACSQGTAFLIDKNYLITCEHVVTRDIELVDAKDEQNKETTRYTFSDDALTISDDSGKALKAKIAGKCAHTDIAILEPCFDASDYPCFTLSAADTSHNQSVTLLGFPNNSAAKKISMVMSKVTTEPFPKSTVFHFEIGDTIRQGFSGGPVLDEKMQVVGIAVEGATYEHGDNGVVQAKHINDLIEKLAGLITNPTS